MLIRLDWREADWTRPDWTRLRSPGGHTRSRPPESRLTLRAKPAGRLIESGAAKGPCVNSIRNSVAPKIERASGRPAGRAAKARGRTLNSHSKRSTSSSQLATSCAANHLLTLP